MKSLALSLMFVFGLALVAPAFAQDVPAAAAKTECCKKGEEKKGCCAEKKADCDKAKKEECKKEQKACCKKDQAPAATTSTESKK